MAINQSIKMEFLTPSTSFYQNNTFLTSSTNFKIITWNVWFDEFEQKLRYEEIFRICSLHQPDVICFQEVTLNFLQVLFRWDLLSLYEVSDNPVLREPDQYGIITLAKREYQPQFQYHSFPTNMGRKFLVTRLVLPSNHFTSPATSFASMSDTTVSGASSDSKEIYIGNVHLESLEYHHIREQQLSICAEILKAFPYYFLCGDFNFCSYRNRPFCFQNNEETGEMTYCPSPKGCELHNRSLYKIFGGPNEITDLWALLRPGESGYTFDGSINEYCNKNELMRYDRICFHFSGNENISHTSANASVTSDISHSLSMSRSNDENCHPANNAHPSISVPMMNSLSGTTISSSLSFDEMMTKMKEINESAVVTRGNHLVIQPKFVQIIGDEPVLQRKLSDPPPVQSQATIFTSPPPVERPYRTIYNRKLISVFPSDHFGLCGTFQLQFQ